MNVQSDVLISRVAALQKKKEEKGGVKCNIKMMHYFALAAWHGQTVQQTCSQKIRMVQ